MSTGSTSGGRIAADAATSALVMLDDRELALVHQAAENIAVRQRALGAEIERHELAKADMVAAVTAERAEYKNLINALARQKLDTGVGYRFNLELGAFVPEKE